MRHAPLFFLALVFFGLVLFGVLGAGCSASGSGGGPQAHVLQLGTSDGAGVFTPYEDGQAVTLVQGAQGGFHVWMTYVYDGQPGVQARLSRTAHRVSDDAIVLRTEAEVSVPAMSVPLPMFMCPSPIGLSVIDAPVTFELRLSDGDHELAAGQVSLVPSCPDDARDFCLRICTG